MYRRAALYGAPQTGAEWQKCYSALLSLLEERFGPKHVWKRSTKFYDEPDVAEEVCVAVILGLRDAGRNYLEHCKRLGIPTLVVDLGFLRREFGYWQVCVGDLNTPPPTYPDTQRFDALNLGVFSPGRLKNYNTLVVGQVPGDAQHDLDSGEAVMNWGRSIVNEIREAFPRRRVFWRPHPGFNQSLGRPAITSSPDRNVFEMMKDETIGSAVVYNSGLGIDLLRQGVHVVARGPRTVYTDLVSSDIADLENSHPGVEPVRDLILRLSYGQYKLDEFSWSTFERLFELHGVSGDW